MRKKVSGAIISKEKTAHSEAEGARILAAFLFFVVLNELAGELILSTKYIC